MSGLRPAGSTETADLASFLGRLVALDPAAVVRLRSVGARVTAYARLPFGVLVSRTVAGDAAPADVTVGAGDLLTALDRGAGPDMIAWPARREMDWRAALPPVDGWVKLDSVPGDVVLKLVRAGREALRAVPAGAAATAGESLLDHESLTVTGAGRTAVLPLRVLGSLTRMGFLGDRGEPVVVSIAAGWTRLAGAYGSAYQHAAPGLTLGPR
jgi:hypothetical protein